MKAFVLSSSGLLQVIVFIFTCWEGGLEVFCKKRKVYTFQYMREVIGSQLPMTDYREYVADARSTEGGIQAAVGRWVTHCC